MTRKLLEWSDVRPTLLRAQGRSGAEYRLEQRDGAWWLFRFDGGDDVGKAISTGWLADMKALAELHEADALGPQPEPQRIAWKKARRGYYIGSALNGRAYRILQIGETWQLEALERTTDQTGTHLDEGSLAAMKAAAARHATEAKVARRAEEVT